MSRYLTDDQQKIREIKENKKQYLDLLLLADEQEDMIDRYLERGIMYVLDDNGIKAECVVTDEGDGILEIKNLAVAPGYQRRGYGRRMIEHVCDIFRKDHSLIQAGTGDSPETLPFYESCGFEMAFSVKDFFTDNYDHPIFEGGKQLRDMIYLRRRL